MKIYIITEPPDEEYGFRNFVDITLDRKKILEICEKHFSENHIYTGDTKLKLVRDNHKLQVIHIYGTNLQYHYPVYDIEERKIQNVNI